MPLSGDYTGTFYRAAPMNRVHFFVAFSVALLIAIPGCGGKKTAAAKKDYGKPTWLKLDKAKFGKLSDYETNLEGDTVTVFDPDGWERMPSGTVIPPKGFKSVIVFKKDGATIMMTKSRTAKDMPDLDEENIEEFAGSAQQLFRAPVRMLRLGSIIGVMFSKQVADKNRISKKLNRRIVATSINGQLFTYELISDDTISENLLGALYAVISKTQIKGVVAPPDEQAVAVESKPEQEDELLAAVEPTPEPVIAVAPTPEPTKPPVAAVPKPSPAKPESPKPAAPKDKKNTKAILDELDALLN